MLNIPSGIGMGMLFASLSLATQASAEHRADCSDEQRARVKAMAAGLNPFFRALGQAFGIAVGQSAFSNAILSRIGPEVGRDISGLVGIIKGLPESSSARTDLTLAFVESLRVVWWILVALTALLVILTFFTKEFGLGPIEVAKSGGSSEMEADDKTFVVTVRKDDGEKAKSVEV
jgi:hypothetical protein